jgi:hypothetical protein
MHRPRRSLFIKKTSRIRDLFAEKVILSKATIEDKTTFSTNEWCLVLRWGIHSNMNKHKKTKDSTRLY